MKITDPCGPIWDSITKFEMNDRGAAGTGKFLEVMARSLGYTIDRFGTEALRATKNLQINSMCRVFAESEVTSLVAGGEDPREIALGLHRSLVRQAASMLNRVSSGNDVVFVGGDAKNPCIRRLLEEALEQEVLVPNDL